MLRRLSLLAAIGALAVPGVAHAQAELRAVSAEIPVRTDNGDRALEVYRALLPRGLQPAPQPRVGVWLAELAFGASRGRPMDDASHWIEGAVQLRVVADNGLEGWYPIHYPVTAEFWFQAGRYVGLPKRHATASIAADGPGWTATAHPRGSEGPPSMLLAWKPDAASDAAAARRALLIPSDPLLVLNAPMRGPDLMRVQYVLTEPQNPILGALPGSPPSYTPNFVPDAGPVRVTLRDDIDLLQEADLPRIFPEGARMSDIVVLDQTVPGSHAHAYADVGSESEKIGEGGYGPRPSAPAPAPSTGTPSSGPAPSRRCRTTRAVTLRAFPGARIRRVRATVGRRRIPVRLIPGRRARLDLRALRPGRHRMRIVVVQSRGLRTITRRTVSVCRA